MAEHDDTPDMLSVPGSQKVLEEIAAGSFTQEKAEEAGRLALAGLTAALGIPKITDLCVIQWGREAERRGEPAHMTGKVMSSNPHAPGHPGFFAIVQFEDEHIDYVDMTWHFYTRGQKPPWFLSHDVSIDVTEDDGETRSRVIQTNRPEDRRGWLEFIAEKDVRKSLTVKEG